MRAALEATAFALPLADIDPRAVAAAMEASIDLHESDGFVWSAQGMAALLALREHAEVIVRLDASLSGLWGTLLGWGLAVTDQPLDTFAGVAVIIACPPFALTEAMAHAALEVA